jgi:methylmalonyl-CoA/ethylmalonyl-CoA epimerase
MFESLRRKKNVNTLSEINYKKSPGVQPEDENGKPLACANLQSPSGARIIWLPKRFGHFSIEILEEKALEAFIEAAFS